MKGLVALLFAVGCGSGEVKLGDDSPGATDSDTGVVYDSAAQTLDVTCSVDEGNLEAVRTHEGSPDTNFQGESVYIGSSAASIEVALVYCDLSDLGDYTVTDAQLSFTSSETKRSSYDGEPNAISLEAYPVVVPTTPDTVTYGVLDAYGGDAFGDRLDYQAVFVEADTPEEDRRFTFDVTDGALTGDVYTVALKPLEKTGEDPVDPRSYEYQADAIASDFTMQLTLQLND